MKSKETHKLVIPCAPGEVSDGYHTFDELYNHRHHLMLALMMLSKDSAWFSDTHADGVVWDGWLIVGINTPAGSVTYHVPDTFRSTLTLTGATCLDNAPDWDGHTSSDVLDRLSDWVANNYVQEPKVDRRGYVLAMAVLQSKLPLDSEQIEARDYFLEVNKQNALRGII